METSDGVLVLGVSLLIVAALACMIYTVFKIYKDNDDDD